MSKSVDVDLRIRAKNLAGKTLTELNAQVEELAKNQVDQSNSAALAARSTKELIAEQKALAATTRELTRRRGLAQQFADQRVEIGATANKLKELTARYREMQASAKGQGTLIGFSDKDLKAVGKEVVQTNRALEGMIAKNKKLGDSLDALGVDINHIEREMGQFDGAIAKSSAAYDKSVSSVERHSVAVERNAAAQAEAARRQQETAESVRRAQAQFSAAAGRASELSALRADIEARSAAARATEVQAEAARRHTADLAAEEAAQRRATESIRAAVQAQDRLRQMRADAVAAFGAEYEAQQRSIAIRDRLVRFLNTERGQRILNSDSMRRETGELARNSAAHRENAAAVDRGRIGLGLFDDTGRKSLGTYQRIRGQVLSLAAAYIGVYQAISTFQKALEATTKNQSLRTGLKVVNNGDARAAAEDYEFLRREADRLGLVFDDVAPQFANLAIAGKAVGISGNALRQIFTDVSTSAAAMNLSVEDTEGVFRAMVQIMSKGKVQAEELRGQLGDRLPGAVVKFAQANNIALTDLDKKLKEGSVGIGFLINGIQAYADQYDSSLDDVTNRLQAYINRAKNSYNDFLRSLLTGANDARLKEAFARITEFFQSREGKEFATDTANAIGKLIDLFILLASNVDKVILVIKAMIALTAVKFFVDMASSAVGAGRALIEVAKAAGAARTAYLGAAAAGTAMTTQTRLMGLAFGPVGIALAALTAGVYAYINSIEQGRLKTQKFIDVMDDLAGARGVEEITSSISGAKKEAKKLGDEAERLNLLKNKFKDGLLPSPTKVKASLQLMREGFVSVEQVQERINEATKQQGDIIAGVEIKERELAKARQERLKEQAKTAEEMKNIPVIVAPDAAEKQAKAVKESVSPEDTARQQEAATRAVRRQILDLQDEIAKIQQEGGVRTQAQLDKNLQLQLERNRIAFEDEMEKIGQLRDAAAKADQEAAERGRATTDRSAEFAQLEGLVQKRLEVADAAAREEAVAESIRLKEQAVNDLIAKRNAMVALYAAQAEAGVISQGEAYAQTIAAQELYNEQIRTMTTDLLTFLQTIDPSSDLYAKLGIDRVIMGLKQIQAEATKITATQQFFKNYSQQIAAGMSNTFMVLAKGIAGAIEGTNSWTDAIKNTWDAFRNFAADFLQQIAEMIIQQLILYAIQVLTGSAQGGFSINTAMQGGYGKMHSGGIVGRDKSGTARVSPLVFAGAQKFHNGGLPGLKSNEVPTILKRGEEVVTEDNPRHIGNAGAGGTGDVTVINSIDPASVVQQGWGTNSTRRVVLNDIQANKSAYKQALGIKS